MQVSGAARVVLAPNGKSILEVAGRDLFELNPLAATIWSKLSDGLSIQEIIGQLVTRYGVPEERVTNDVKHFTESLKQHALIKEDSVVLESHAELVWNKGIASMCDWRIPDEFPASKGYWSVPEPEGHMLPPTLLDNLISAPTMYRAIRDGDLVWVKLSWLKSFLKQVLPLVKAKFVLVTGDSIASVPSEVMSETQEVLDYANVVHWYAQNCDSVGVTDRISPLPLGIDFHTLNDRPCWGENVLSSQQQEQMLLSIRKDLPPARGRIRKVYIDFAWQPAGFRASDRRQEIVEKLRTNECVFFQKGPLRRSKLWRKCGEYAFVLSPHGLGLDCHRTWEALALGHIVLVPKSPLDTLYEGLPVIPIKEWDEITPENLEAWLSRYFGCEIDEEKLKSRYWVDKMRATLNNSPVKE